MVSDFTLHQGTCNEFHSIISADVKIYGRLLQAGCSLVIITSRKKEDCETASKALNGLETKVAGARAVGIPADLSRAAEIERFFGEVAKITDHVDILFANAGVAWGAPFDTHPEIGLTKVWDLNVKSVFLTIQRLLPFSIDT